MPPLPTPDACSLRPRLPQNQSSAALGLALWTLLFGRSWVSPCLQTSPAAGALRGSRGCRIFSLIGCLAGTSGGAGPTDSFPTLGLQGVACSASASLCSVREGTPRASTYSPMSRPPRSATPNSRRSPHSTAPPAPAMAAGGNASTPLTHASSESVDLCCVCLEALLPTGRNAELAVPFPACIGHCLHLGCVAQLRAQARSPAELLCPLCRHSSCAACVPGGWTGRHDAELRQLCAQHGLPVPERLSGESTVREVVRDYTLRTFTRNDAPEPRPPPGVSVLCCHRVAPAHTPGEPAHFVELPDRSMPWAPAPIRHSTGIAAWRPAWVCPRCGEEAGLDDVDVPPQAGDPCERCGVIQQWTFDRFTARGELSCSAACAPAGLPPDAAPPPAPPAVAPGASGQPSTAGGSSRNVPSARTVDVWAMCGPPQGVPAPTNSWLYVPLLRAAAGQLQGPALEQWRQDPRTVPWWEHACTALATSDPVLAATLIEAFVAAVTHAGEALPQELLAEASALPPNTSVHLGWVVRNLLQPDGYITAACQEVCLQLFGGLELPTELNRHSDAFRPPAPLPPSDAEEERVPDDAALATAALAARRLEQTRGPGCPGSGAATHSGARRAHPVGPGTGTCARPWTPRTWWSGRPAHRRLGRCPSANSSTRTRSRVAGPHTRGVAGRQRRSRRAPRPLTASGARPSRRAPTSRAHTASSPP